MGRSYVYNHLGAESHTIDGIHAVNMNDALSTFTLLIGSFGILQRKQIWLQVLNANTDFKISMQKSNIKTEWKFWLNNTTN